MLLNAEQVEEMLITHGLGKKAQVGYDLTVKDVKDIRGGCLFADETQLDESDLIFRANKAKDIFISNTIGKPTTRLRTISKYLGKLVKTVEKFIKPNKKAAKSKHKHI